MEVNKEKILKHFDNDTELLNSLVQILEKQYMADIEAMHTAIESSDVKKFTMHAHNIKGSLSNFFVESIVESAKNLEMTGRAGSLPSSELVDELSTNVEKLIGLLRE